MSSTPTDASIRRASRKQVQGLAELVGLTRSLRTPCTTSSVSCRPCTSWGNSASTSVKLIHFPPAVYLPPHAPPKQLISLKPDYSRPSTLPKLANPQRPKRIIRKKTTSQPLNIVIKNFVSKSVQTITASNKSKYVCRLCGSSCQSGDMLHAHLLLLKHSSISKVCNVGGCQSVSVSCRRCGASWVTDNDEKKSFSHPCILQKAAYFKNILSPQGKIRQGLPFMCLFCCAENENSKTFMKNHSVANRRHLQRRIPKKALPMRLHQTAMRFNSKLQLAIHVVYFHAPTRRIGHCKECSEFTYEPEKGEISEFAFWQPENNVKPLPKIKRLNAPSLKAKESFDSEKIVTPPSPTPSSCSILERTEINDLDKHIIEEHTLVYEYLSWLTSKHGFSDISLHTNNRTSWIYACPFCQIQPFSPVSNFSPMQYDQQVRPEYGMSGNAMLQAHLACFHSGTNFIDWKLQICQVCGDSLFTDSLKCNREIGELALPQQRHLIRRGHLVKLKNKFSTAIEQGRIQEEGGPLQEIDWDTTCVLCWKRFGGPMSDHNYVSLLQAECQLQAHLVSAHCVFSNSESSEYECGQILACGWCGNMRQKPEHITSEQYTAIAKGDMLQHNRRQSRIELLANFQWALSHEEEHADGLFRWWRGVVSNEQNKLCNI